jgi:hypothetical protein
MRWILLALLTLPGCSNDKPGNGLPAFLQALASSDKVVLYSIDGTEKEDKAVFKDAEKFQGYPVLGKLDLKDVRVRQQVVEALHQGIVENVGFAKCFWPRHAFQATRGGKTTDYVICFQCNWIKVIDGNKVEDIVTTNHAQKLLNQLLKDAGIPIAP